MKLNQDIVFRKEFDGTATLFNVNNGEVFYLNKVCTLIYEQLEKGLDREEILAMLPDRVNNIPDNIGEQLDSFLKQLAEKKIIDPA